MRCGTAISTTSKPGSMGRSELSALFLSLFLAASCNGQAHRGNVPVNDEKAWRAVVDATDAESQRARLEEFLKQNTDAGAPALQVSVRSLDTGEKARIDKALWDNPQRYEVTLRYGERQYVFIPKSRASLDPLFRE